jgi:hypothetical protein
VYPENGGSIASVGMMAVTVMSKSGIDQFAFLSLIEGAV